ncbi:unnamed protein product [Rotaria magnacalcarata]|uniref:Uncharacterized protein n=1 Tax=Rotaria magnacalcarata TaxID=392030 RepID=A0A816CLM7_9BILA|nr:unnamed protein product [Rotaria magnacalcarata]
MNFSVITSGSRRKRVARTVFTPTQTATIISNYYLLHFIETESYQIAARSSIKKFDKEGFATLQIRRKMLQAKIILAANGDEEDSEEHSDSDDAFENNSAPINKRKNMANNVTKKKQRLNIDDQTTSNRSNNQSETTFPGVSIFNLMERKFDIIEKRLLSIENHSGEKMARLTKKIDNLSSASIINKVAIDTYRDENNESFRKDLMYGDIDLLQTMGSTFGDFARKTMKIVFTEEELKERILPPQRSHLSRPSLDLAKFRIVNDAIRIKYKIDSTKYDAFYKNVLRRKLSDFLIEERRRESIKSTRDLIRTQMQTNPPSSHQLMPVLVNVE